MKFDTDTLHSLDIFDIMPDCEEVHTDHSDYRITVIKWRSPDDVQNRHYCFVADWLEQTESGLIHAPHTSTKEAFTKLKELVEKHRAAHGVLPVVCVAGKYGSKNSDAEGYWFESVRLLRGSDGIKFLHPTGKKPLLGLLANRAFRYYQLSIRPRPKNQNLRDTWKNSIKKEISNVK